jgi:glutamate carboxypeptidase
MQDVLDHCRRLLPQGLRFLEQMVSTESPTLDKKLTDEFVLLIQNYFQQFQSIGAEIQLVPAEKFGMHFRMACSGKSSDRVLLLGHTDTVWPAGETRRRPFRIDGGRALGPGVFDMKAGILLMWMALDALNKTRGFNKSVTVLLTSDEELGSSSSRTLIETEAGACRAVFVLEPSLPDGALKTARKGSGRFTVKAIGRAAHAGVDPEKGINAIDEISRQVLKIHRIADVEHGTTVNVGLIQGGTRSNIVPAEAAVEVDVRITSFEEAARVTRAIQSLAPELDGARLDIHGTIHRPPMERTSETVRLFEIAREVGRKIGLDLREGSTGGASDGNLTSALGIPTLDGLGPVGGGPHAVDEWVDVESLPARAALVAGLINDC